MILTKGYVTVFNLRHLEVVKATGPWFAGDTQPHRKTIYVNNGRLRLHRVIKGLGKGPHRNKGETGSYDSPDHNNGYGMDNRDSNLSMETQQRQVENRFSFFRGNLRLPVAVLGLMSPAEQGLALSLVTEGREEAAA